MLFFFPAIPIVTLSLCLKSVAALEGAYKSSKSCHQVFFNPELLEVLFSM